MLHCFSVSYQNAPLSIREKIDFTQDELADWLKHQQDVVILSTCNRVELYSTVESYGEALGLWVDLTGQHGVEHDALAPYTTYLKNFDAAQHLFHVASSLRSMALGETQILGQVTQAYVLAQECTSANHQLSLLLRSAIHTSKRVHSETNIDVGNVSVSSLGIAKMEDTLGSLRNQKILIIGAGEMGQAVVKGLDRRQLADVTLVSRTFERAKEVANLWNIEARTMIELKNMLTQVDVVFTTSSAPFPILNAEDLLSIMDLRNGRNLYIVDIAVPRDVAADVNDIPNVFVFNIDDLQQVVDHNLQEREAAIPQAHRIIDEELTKFWHELESLAVVPTIRQIRDQAETIRQSELQRIMGKLPPEEQTELRRLFEEFSHRLMNKMLHQPTHNLRAGNNTMMASVARSLFGLEDA